MADTTRKKGAPKMRHLGRHAGKTVMYYENIYHPRKLLHMFKAHQFVEAVAYAKVHGLTRDYNRLATRFGRFL